MGAAVAVVVLVALVGASIALAMFLRRRNEGLASGNRRVDPFTIGEPWRRHVAGAQSAQRRFRAQVESMASGPLRARMAEIGRQLDRAVEDCWDVARRGHELDAAIRTLDPRDLRERLGRAAAGREATSLRAQLASVDRIRAARDDAEQQLRVLQARLGEIVANAAEVSVGLDPAGDEPQDAAAAELGSAVDDVVVQLEALRLAVREVEEPIAGLGGGSAQATG